MTGIAALLGGALLAPLTLGGSQAQFLYHGVFWAMLLVALAAPWGTKLALWLATCVHGALAVVVLYIGGQSDVTNWSVAAIALVLTLWLFSLTRQADMSHSATAR